MIKKYLDVIILATLFAVFIFTKSFNANTNEIKPNANFKLAYETGCFRALFKLSDLREVPLDDTITKQMTLFCKDPDAK